MFNKTLLLAAIFIPPTKAGYCIDTSDKLTTIAWSEGGEAGHAPALHHPEAALAGRVAHQHRAAARAEVGVVARPLASLGSTSQSAVSSEVTWRPHLVRGLHPLGVRAQHLHAVGPVTVPPGHQVPATVPTVGHRYNTPYL